MKVISYSDFNKRLAALDKEADEKIGEGIVPFEDLFEIAMKEQLLNAAKWGAEQAAWRARLRSDGTVGTSSARKRLVGELQEFANNLTIDQLPK
jgi:hypothetical protein